VAPKSAIVPDVVTAGLDKVAVRVPAHPMFIEVVRKLGEPIAAPSANASSRPSPTTAADVLASLTVPVLDGGACRLGIESTVVDVTGVPHVLRLGATRVDEIRAFLPDVVVGGDLAASPGTRHKHYAPLGKRVIIVDDPSEARDAAVLAHGDDPIEYARNFYANLYRLERSSSSVIAIVRVPEGDAWAAVRDRIARAAEH
jgi:L-threonylcarbamoyladenylate synthase